MRGDDGDKVVPWYVVTTTEDPPGINPVLRGWAQYFRTGNAADKFVEVDRYVAWRLKRLRIKHKGRHLKPREPRRWTPQYFYALGLQKLSRTVAYPDAA